MSKALELYGEKQRLETKIENAKKMISKGKLALDEIAEYSGLPLEKVKELASVKIA